MGLAKRNAKKKPISPEQQQFRQQLGQEMQADQAQEQGMVDKMSAYNRMQQDKQRMMEIPKEYEPSQGGEMETLAYVNPEEMQMLREAGGSGEMTEYGVPSFARPENYKGPKTRKTSSPKKYGSTNLGTGNRKANRGDKSNMSRGGGWSHGGPGSDEGAGAAYKRSQAQAANAARGPGRAGFSTVGGGGGGSQYKTGSAHGDAVAARGGESGGTGGTHPTGPPPGVSQAQYNQLQRQYDEYKGGEAARQKEAADRRMQNYRKSERAKRLGEYEGYKGEAKGLGAEAKGVTGEFGKDATKLAGYQSKFDTMAGEAKTRGDEGEKFLQGEGIKYTDAAGKGAEALKGIGEGYKGVTGQGMVDAAKAGQEGFEAGAKDLGEVREQFGQEGFQKDVGGYESQIAGLAEKAMGGDLGQREAGMLRGQMEESRMASQKGSEEKLRRSLAQSGASPAEIAAKVAQFQKSSAGQQAQAGRSEALSSQLQGQQMGQARLGQAAGLMGQGAGMVGQRAGMAGQQASIGAQQAALRGQGAAMQMQGAQGQQQAQLASLGGQAAMAQGAAGLNMQGIQGGANMYGQGMAAGMQGQQQQAQMMGQGMGAIQAAGGARSQQMAGIGTQGQFVDQQAGFTQAQLNDVIAQETQAYQEKQGQAQRAANAAANSGGGGGGGGLLSGISKVFRSDIRLKENIELLEEGKGGDPNIYSFNYKWQPKHRWSGVMAQELLGTKHADSVRTHPDGYYRVDYHKLGIQMKLLS